MRSPWGDTASIGAIFKVGNGASVALSVGCRSQVPATVVCLGYLPDYFGCLLQLLASVPFQRLRRLHVPLRSNGCAVAC